MTNYLKNEQEPLWQQIAGYVLAIAIGIGLAVLLIAWWSS